MKVCWDNISPRDKVSCDWCGNEGSIYKFEDECVCEICLKSTPLESENESLTNEAINE
jgi:hypothetical protein